jgi:nucleotide-binding universal stress UspA family protein
MRILYATDNGEAARAAATLLTKLGRRDRAEVTVLSVSSLKHVDPRVELDDTTGPVEKGRRYAAHVVDQAVSEFANAGFSVKGEVVEGAAAIEVARLLDDDGYDLVLVGAGNKSWLDRLLHGSVSMHLLHSSPTSVLVVHEARDVERARVLVADDGSESADNARQLLVELVDPKTCEITVISVVTPLDLAVVPNRDTLTPEAMPVDPVEIQELEKSRISRANARVEEAGAALRSAGYAVDSTVAIGRPASEILERAEKGNYDLVLMGSRGLGAVGSALLGSVSDAVTRHARATLVARG